MMNTALSTSRANSRNSKDKSAKTATQAHNTMKIDGPPKVQPTQEQIRIAQMIEDRTENEDRANRKIEKIEQVMEASGKTYDEAAVALHDAEFDPEKAVIMLLEGENDQGEWKESGKKKKRTNTAAASTPKSEPVSNHISENRSEIRERSKDCEHRTADRAEFGHRRARRTGPVAPRHARSRGRDRSDFRENKENEDESNEDGGRERNFGRGRGRGVGRRGRGPRSFRNQRFDKGPQIDTWTNETAENAEKENSTWNDTLSPEDWNDDSWTGSSMGAAILPLEPLMCNSPFSLAESKVFIASSVQSVPPTEPCAVAPSGSPAMNDATNTSLSRLDLGALLQKAQDPVTEAQYIAQYNQQATESLKNTIGIGTSSNQTSGLPSSIGNQSVNSMVSLSGQQSSGSHLASLSAANATGHPATSHSVSGSTTVTQSNQHTIQQQRVKPQRTKLPPPSKIPTSAVEMPHHLMPQLDVQFGNLEFRADSSPFSFTVSDTAVTCSFTTAVTNNSSGISNHMSSSSQQSADSVMTSSMLSSNPSSKSIGHLEQSAARANMFPNSYQSPAKKEVTASALVGQASKIATPDPIPFPSSPNERKSSPLIGPGPRTGQSPSSLSQSAVPVQKAETNSLNSFTPPGSTYPTASYQSHKPASVTSSLSSTTVFSHPSNSLSQSNSAHYPAQYQTQYPNTPQYNHQGYQTSSSFQSQSSYSSNQPNQNSLYQSSAQTSSYQPQGSNSNSTTAYHPREAQSTPANSYQTVVSQSSYQRSNQANLAATSQPPPVIYSNPTYGSAHPSSLQTSPLTDAKLSESLSKMTVKDTSLENSQSSAQYDHSVSATTTTVSLTTTTSTTPSLTSSTTSGSVMAATTTTPSTKATPQLPNTGKAPPNLPPGVPLLSHQYIMGQGTIPPYFSLSQSLQQPLYTTSYDELQMIQQRMPMASNYYDMATFPVPTTLTSRDQATLGSVPGYSATDNKLSRVEAQSPIPTTQQQSSQSAHQQPYINLHYPYYYPSMLPGAAGFQYHTMFAMPPVTNTAHGGNTGTAQYQKNYGSHAYNTGGKTSGVGSGAASTADIPGSGYGKSHGPAFEKQGFHTGTPPPFSLPLATGTQAGPMGAPTTPYGTPFVPLVTHQPHSQMLHHPLQQDSSGGSSRGAQQASTQPKSGGSKNYAPTYWSAS
ncbi:ubiquitin-associated protein 2-like isoform X4 [Octopus sinensis]|uniref:Ubiquitin-associated protein 2-like isoform X4 n=1 Tax=Octopus sinensis TaxID=2607531 RepID=A0A6P7SSF4_9MOLL|nr:ubiquitin-associated protein 2-like isoform X4 [Octopus sinensis]